jgi:hypothetical protein
MPRSFPNRPARHGAGPGLVAIACLVGAALAVDRAVRHAPATLQGAKDVLAAAAISAIILGAGAVLVIITWGALRLGRQAPQSSEEISGLPGPGLTVPEPEPVVLPRPDRLPGRPLFIHGPVSAAARAAAAQAAAADQRTPDDAQRGPGSLVRDDGSGGGA